MSKGTSTIKRYRKVYTHYNFFDDPKIPIFGLDEPLDKLVKFIRGAAGGFGSEKRVLLLHGPVGSSKSTICRLLKRGLEDYSKTDDGAWYTYKWVNLPESLYTHKEDECPMHDDPLRLLPTSIRKSFIDKVNANYRLTLPAEEQNNAYTFKVEGELNPRSNKFMTALLEEYEGDLQKVLENHILVVRKVFSEANRMGIATFQPKDEKNQDATELTGDIDYSKLPHFGADSDPRAFNFDGEFCVGNRGITEFIEMLKLQETFLYDLLGASQEKSIKPKKFSQIPIDEVIIGHTNNPEFEKLKNNPMMEALRDRTVKIDIPYLLRWSDEIKVLKQDYGQDKVNQHVAPHTIEIAALWLILTRLKDDKDAHLSLADKAKLYDGKFLPGYTEDRVKELIDKYEDEGISGGVSVRYAQDKISTCLSSHHVYINPFMVLNEIKDGLTNSSLITNKEEIEKYINCVDLALKELDDILKNEVQKALVGDEEAIVRLCANYIDNIQAYIFKTKVLNPYTGKEQEPDERLMRAIEEKIDVPETGADDFRRQVAQNLGSNNYRKTEFRWDSDPQLMKALQAKLFEDTKDHIKLSAIGSGGTSVQDPAIQEKIDAVKQRMIKDYGYNQQSAQDVLDYVSSLFARGDAADE
jgi:serine protein kinase